MIQTGWTEIYLFIFWVCQKARSKEKNLARQQRDEWIPVKSVKIVNANVNQSVEKLKLKMSLAPTTRKTSKEKPSKSNLNYFEKKGNSCFVTRTDSYLNNSNAPWAPDTENKPRTWRKWRERLGTEPKEINKLDMLGFYSEYNVAALSRQSKILR